MVWYHRILIGTFIFAAALGPFSFAQSEEEPSVDAITQPRTVEDEAVSWWRQKHLTGDWGGRRHHVCRCFDLRPIPRQLGRCPATLDKPRTPESGAHV